MVSTQTREMEECIEACEACASACLSAVPHCLEKGGDHAEPAHIGLLLDCADICQTSARFMTRGSDLHAEVCGVCSFVCKECEEDCEEFEDDPVMVECAAACRECAEACRRMADSEA